MTTLVPSGPHRDNEIHDLHAQVTGLERLLTERRDEATQARAEMDTFRIIYRQKVGLLHEELDRLELELAEAELGILKERLGDSTDAPDPASIDRDQAPPRFTTDAIRKLFRDVAKAIHQTLPKAKTRASGVTC